MVLDKSFLDSVTWPQLQYYAGTGWTFGIAPVLMYEHFRKDDRRRKANLFKLHKIEENLAILPGIGEMFRQEGEKLKPSSTIMRAKSTTITVEKGPSGEYFELDEASRQSTEKRTEELKQKLDLILNVWNDFRRLPSLQEASHSDRPQVIQDLKMTIRDDVGDIRGFYANHRHPNFPPSEIIEKDWSYFRWTQVHLLAGLDFMSTHGIDTKPNEENMIHELLDLDYLISALLVGGLACREKRVVERFRFLRPDGVILGALR